MLVGRVVGVSTSAGEAATGDVDVAAGGAACPQDVSNIAIIMLKEWILYFIL